MYNIYYNPDENAKGLIENEINKMDGLLEEKIQKKETELKETMRTKKGNITKIVHDPLKTFSNQQRKETNIIGKSQYFFRFMINRNTSAMCFNMSLKSPKIVL